MKRSAVVIQSLILIGFFSSCTDQSNCCINIELSIDVELQNTEGSDMLDPSISGHIAMQDISVYYEIDGKLETYASLNDGARLDNPEGFIVQSEGEKNLLHVFSNPTVGENVVTIIRIKDRADIELVTEVKSNHGKQITNVWFDGQLVWSSATAQSAPRVVVKVD